MTTDHGRVPGRLLVVGTGLMGTSVALAARGAGVDVHVHDTDEHNLRWAITMGAGTPYEDGVTADLALLAMPPHLVGSELAAWQERKVATAYTDVASVKATPRQDAERLGCELTSYAGGHPLAGRELSGPRAAASDLFLGRPWAICPGTARQEVVELVAGLATVVGAVPLTMTDDEHDAAVAAVSHAPHVLASVLAAGLVEADTRLAGQGVRDVTRVADGDPHLWTAILTGNAGSVADVLDQAAARTEAVAAALRSVAAGDDASAGRVRDLLERGVAGRLALPGKHGGPTRSYAVVTVVLPDEPGQLARLFHDAEATGVNVEDVSLEHAPGALVGVMELSVRPDSRDTLTAGLRAAGWDVPG